MPTASGGETNDEKLTRLRTELTRARAVIERAETNGTSFSAGGWSVTQIAYERALEREKTLTRQINSLEAKIEGRAPGGRAQLHSKMAR